MTRRPLALVAPGKGGARIVSLNRAARQGGLVEGELALQCPLQGARPAVARRRSCRRRRRPAQAGAVVPALYADRGAVGRGKRRRRPVPRHHGVRASLRRRGAAAGRSRAAPARVRALPAHGNRRHGRRVLGDGAPWSRRRQDRGLRARKASALQALPLAALRLSAETQALMRRLGFKRIGELDRSAARAVCRALRAGVPAPPRPGAGARARAARPRRCRRPSIARRRCSSSRS